VNSVPHSSQHTLNSPDPETLQIPKKGKVSCQDRKWTPVIDNYDAEQSERDGMKPESLGPRRQGNDQQHSHRRHQPNSDFVRENGWHASWLEPDNQKAPAHQPFTSGSSPRS